MMKLYIGKFFLATSQQIIKLGITLHLLFVICLQYNRLMQTAVISTLFFLPFNYENSTEEKELYSLFKLSVYETLKQDHLERFPDVPIPSNPLTIPERKIKSLTDELKLVSKHIDEACAWRQRMLDADGKVGFSQLLIDELVEYKKKIEKQKEQARLRKKLGKGNDMKLSIEGAKMVPLDKVLTFNNAGVAPCPFHSEKTASFKWYKKENKGHCFGCGKHADGIDIVCHLYSLKFLQGVEYLLKI